MSVGVAIGRRRWAPVSAEVNPSHPLAFGLLGVGIGTRVIAGRCSRTSYSGTPTTPRGFASTPFGMGAGDRTAQGDGPYAFRTHLSAGPPTSISLMAWVNTTNTSGNGAFGGCAIGLHGVGASYVGGQDGAMIGIGAANSGGANAYALDSAMAHHTTSTAVAGTGWRCLAASTTSGGTFTMLLDGLVIYSGSGGHRVEYEYPAHICIAAEQAAYRAFEGEIGPWAAWGGRHLTNAEHAALYADPFCMLTY